MNDSVIAAEGRITTEARGHVFLIGIDRPKKLNGFTLKMLRELAEAFTALEQGPQYRCGLLFAHGANFTAGLQLDQVGPHMAAGNPVFPPHCVDPMALRPPMRSKPVVIAVQGICFTIGIELMLACDIVIAADNCRFAQIEVKRGIMPTGGATMRFVERAGWGNAQRYLLTGDEFNAAEAHRLGFVQEVVAAGREFDRALVLATTIAEQAPLAVQASLASSRRYVERGPIGMAVEMDAVQRDLSQSEDAAEGVRSFVERRKAAFQGR
ncbi:MAG: crotonase/enoyl-CoA hydratase family protein [Burkholderiales bacterium]|nr:crotonase/enoyl-CoA hydratase family protein [Burkholderiales bacterium]